MRKRRELGRIRRGSTFERSIFRLPALFTLFGREPTDTDRARRRGPKKAQTLFGREPTDTDRGAPP
jgi:hypothetical protein